MLENGFNGFTKNVSNWREHSYINSHEMRIISQYYINI